MIIDIHVLPSFIIEMCTIKENIERAWPTHVILLWIWNVRVIILQGNDCLGTNIIHIAEMIYISSHIYLKKTFLKKKLNLYKKKTTKTSQLYIRNAGDVIVHTTGACSMELPKMAAVIKNRNFFIWIFLFYLQST